MIIGILRYRIVTINDFIKLRNGIFKITLLIISIPQLIIIRIVPFSASSFVGSQVRNGFVIFLEVKITLPNDFIQL